MMAVRKKAAKKSPKKKAVKTSAKKTPAKKVKKPAPRKGTRKSAKTPVKKAAVRSKKPPTPKPVVQSHSLVGQEAPSFTLPTGDGQSIALSEFRGQRVLLYFYPKDDTPGCTAQACALRDDAAQFASSNTVVIGVSKDDVASHHRFKTKYQLNFILASDKETGVCEKYGVWTEKNMYGRKYMGIQRSTFLIDEKGIVRAEWRKVSVADHMDNVRTALAAL